MSANYASPMLPVTTENLRGERRVPGTSLEAHCVHHKMLLALAYVCICVCMCVCVHICACACVRVSVHIFMCLCVC